MYFPILFALILGVATASANEELKRDALDEFKDLPEIQAGHAPAKDYIVIEINKPIAHYFAAEAHEERESREFKLPENLSADKLKESAKAFLTNSANALKELQQKFKEGKINFNTFRQYLQNFAKNAETKAESK